MSSLLKLLLSKTICRNLAVLAMLGAVLCYFPFKTVWGQSFVQGWTTFLVLGCTSYPVADGAIAQCTGSAGCKYTLDDGTIVPGMFRQINLMARQTGFCTTSPVRNSVRIYGYTDDPLFRGLNGEGETLVVATALPLDLFFNGYPCDPSGSYWEYNFPFSAACPPVRAVGSACYTKHQYCLMYPEDERCSDPQADGRICMSSPILIDLAGNGSVSPCLALFWLRVPRTYVPCE